MSNTEAPARESMTPEELKDWRKAAGLSAAEMAEHIGVTTRAIHYWEAGERRIPRWLIKRLAE